MSTHDTPGPDDVTRPQPAGEPTERLATGPDDATRPEPAGEPTERIARARRAVRRHGGRDPAAAAGI